MAGVLFFDNTPAFTYNIRRTFASSKNFFGKPIDKKQSMVYNDKKQHRCLSVLYRRHFYLLFLKEYIMENVKRIPEIFGCRVFNDDIMRARLPKDVYKSLSNTIATGKEESSV